MNLKFPASLDSPPLKFVTKGLILYFCWILLYEFLIRPHHWIDPWLTRLVSEHSVNILRALGYRASDKIIDTGTVLYNNLKSVLRIAYICNGLILYILFLIFLLAFPGPAGNKFWFIPAGFILIYLMNLARVVSLVIIQIESPEYLEFNHKYTFNMVIYGLIFILWYIWVRNFSSRKHVANE